MAEINILLIEDSETEIQGFKNSSIRLWEENWVSFKFKNYKNLSSDLYQDILENKYDFVIVDCPPSFGIVTTAVLKVASKLIVPIATKNVDTEGLTGFFDRMDNIYIKDNFNIEKIIIMPNMYDKRVNDSKQTLGQDINQIPNMLQCKTNLRFIKSVVTEPLPQNSAIQEAPSYNMFLVPFIMEYSRSKNSNILLIIKNIVNELFK